MFLVIATAPNAASGDAAEAKAMSTATAAAKAAAKASAVIAVDCSVLLPMTSR